MEAKWKWKSNSQFLSEEPKQQINGRHERAKSQVWDCGSSLYDSFELQSLKRQLDSAIIASRRSLSMPHLSDRRAPPPPSTHSGKKSSKISRSLHKIFRSVFRSSKPNVGSRTFQSQDRSFCVVYEKTGGALATIPEVPEIDCGAISPDFNSIERRTASARFTTTSTDVSCSSLLDRLSWPH